MPGTWDVTAVGPHTLSNVRRAVTIAPGENAVDMGTLREGDVNGDGRVFLTDVGLFVGSYTFGCGDAGYNPNADLNNNCEVFLTDVGIFVGNYTRESPIELAP